MTKTLWIGPVQNEIAVGDVAFLIEIENEIKGWSRHELRETPARTNQSLQDKLSGWCGSYNDLSTWASGLVRVERLAKNGRAFVRRLDGEELRSALETLGYPELFDTGAAV